MKKHYLNSITLGLSMLISGASLAQTDADFSPSQLSQSERNELVNSTKTNLEKESNAVCPQTDTLVSPLLSGNGHAGNMFDVKVGPNDIVLKTFWVSHDSDDQMSVYYKTGTFVGSESTPGDWTYLDSGFVAANGDGLIDAIPVDLNLTLAAGQTYAFYVTNNNVTDINYTNGNNVGDTLTSNSDLTMFEGNGGALFDVTYTPRVFNGAMEYCIASGAGIESLSITEANVYPNPASTELNIDLTNLSIDKSSVVIYNVLGEKVFNVGNLSVAANNTIDISNLVRGMYVVTITADGESFSTKVLVD